MERREPSAGVRRVALIGFMAAGKSTVGRLLADRIGWDFLDFDVEIERRTGRSVGEIFRAAGEPEFRRLEAELTRQVAARARVVLAPGGGWITQPELVDALGSETFLVWLRISPEEAARRARLGPTHRPLLAGPDPLARARRLLRRREPFFRVADAVVDVDGRDPEEVAAEIASLLRDRLE